MGKSSGKRIANGPVPDSADFKNSKRQKKSEQGNSTNEDGGDNTAAFAAGAAGAKLPLMGEKEFKQAVGSGSYESILEALLRFNDQCRGADFSSSNPAADVAFGYLELSPECTELFHAWENAGPNQSKLNVPLLEAFSYIMRSSSAHPTVRHLGIFVFRKIVRSYMRSVYSCLGSDNIRGAKAALLFLVSVSGHSMGAAKELVNVFNFALPNFTGLANRRNSKDKNDIRSLYIRFALNLLESGDAAVIARVAEIKGFISAIFKLMKEDNLETIQSVLGTLRSRVLANEHVSKTVKVQLLNNAALDQIAQLYARGSVNDDPTLKTGRNAAHAFLLEVSTSPINGIVFGDVRTAAIGKVYNPVLQKFALSLSNVHEDMLVQALLIGILKSCPDVIEGYLQQLSVSLEPRLSLRWLSNMALVTRISTLPYPTVVLNHRAIAGPHHALNLTVPHNLNVSHMKQGLQHASMLVQSTTLAALTSVLRKARVYIDHVQNRDARLVVAFIEGLRKRTPDLQLLLATLIQAQASYSQTPSPQSHMLYTRALQAFGAYQACLPSVVGESRLDFARFLPGPSIQQLLGSSPVVLALVLDILSNAVDYRWAFTKSKGQERSPFGRIALLMAHTEHENIHTKARGLLKLMLLDTGVFASVESEMEQWLNCLPPTGWLDLSMAAVTCLDDAACSIAQDPYVHTDRVAEAIAACQASDVMATLHRYARELHNRDPALAERMGQYLVRVLLGIVLQGAPARVIAHAVKNAHNAMVADGAQVLASRICRLQQQVLIGLEIFLDAQKQSLDGGQLDSHIGAESVLRIIRDVHAEESMMNEAAVGVFAFFLGRVSASWLNAHLSVIAIFCAAHIPGPRALAPLQDILRHTYGAQPLFTNPSVQRALCGGLEGARDDIEVNAMVLLLATLPFSVILLHATAFLMLAPAKDMKILQLVYALLVHSCANLDTSEARFEAVSSVVSILASAIVRGTHADENLVQWCMQLLYVLAREDRSTCMAVLGHPGLLAAFSSAQNTGAHNGVACGLVNGVGVLLDVTVRQLDAADCDQLLAPYAKIAVAELHAALNSDVSPDGMGLAIANARIVEGFHQYGGAEAVTRLISAVLERITEQDVTSESSVAESPIRGLSLSLLMACARHAQVSISHFVTLVQIMASTDQSMVDAVVLALLESAGYVVCADNISAFDVRFKMLVAQHSVLLPQPSAEVASSRNDYAIAMTTEAFHKCFSNPTSVRLRIAAHAVHGNVLCAAKLVELLASDHAEHIADLLASEDGRLLAHAYVTALVSNAIPSDKVTVVFEKILSSLLKAIAQDCGVAMDTVTTAVSGDLIQGKLARQLVGHLKERAATLSLAEVKVAAALASQQVGAELVQLCVDCLCAIYESEAQVTQNSGRLIAAQEALVSAVTNTSSPNMSRGVVSLLAETTIKHKYGSAPALRTLATVFRKHATASMDAASMAGELFNMLVGNPKFVTIMTDAGETAVKGALVELLLILVQLSESAVCDVEQLPVLLAAYTASLSQLDQHLLEVMRYFERNGISLAEYAWTWGPSSYKERSVRAESFHIGAKAAAVLEHLDAGMLLHSVRHFPDNRTLEGEASMTTNVDAAPSLGENQSHNEDERYQSAIYDPAFVLPALCFALETGQDVELRRLIENHVVAYCVRSLSSLDADVRRAGAYALHMVLDIHAPQHVFRESQEVVQVLSSLRNGITSEGSRVPLVISLFICEALQVMLAPDHVLYKPFNKFLLQRPYLPLDDVPLFYSFFLSGSENSRGEQAWMMRLLAQSLKDSADWPLYKRRHVLPLLLTYCDSRASEPATRALVLETLASMSRIPSVAAEIARYQGAGAWLVSYTCAQGGGAQSHAIARSRLQYPLPLYARPSALAHLAPVLEALQVLDGFWSLHGIAGQATSILVSQTSLLIHHAIQTLAAGSCPQSAALPLIRAIVTVVNKASRVAHASGSEDGVQIPPTDMLALLVYYSFASGMNVHGNEWFMDVVALLTRAGYSDMTTKHDDFVPKQEKGTDISTQHALASAAIWASMIPYGSSRLPLAADLGASAVMFIASWVVHSTPPDSCDLIIELVDALKNVASANPHAHTALATEDSSSVGGRLRDLLLSHLRRIGINVRLRRSLISLFTEWAPERYDGSDSGTGTSEEAEEAQSMAHASLALRAAFGGHQLEMACVNLVEQSNPHSSTREPAAQQVAAGGKGQKRSGGQTKET